MGAADLTQATLTGFESLQGTFTLRANQVALFPEIVGSIVLAASGSPVVLDLSATTIAAVTGSSDRETLTLTGSVTSDGLQATLSGEGGADVLTTLGGEDQLFGGDGNDTLNAGAGDDALDGGVGNDVLNGGDGNDVLAGGRGMTRCRGTQATTASWTPLAVGRRFPAAPAMTSSRCHSASFQARFSGEPGLTG